MSRGVVLWPGAATSAAIRALWDALAERGLASLATWTHQLHQPHCSLAVAEELPVEQALAVCGRVPQRPIRLRAESVGVFPGGALFLACVANSELLAEQRRVQAAVAALSVRPWPYFEPDNWVPQVTLAMSLTPEELNVAVALVLQHLPIEGVFDHRGVEDGTTGENWPAK
jgi:hypothetical protein